MQPSRSRPAQPAGGPAHLAPPPLSSSSPTGGRRVPDARAPPRRATSSLPACLSSPRRSGWTGRRHATPRTSLPLSHSSPSPGSLSPDRPNAPVATARRSRSHRAPREHLSSPRAPPRRRLPPRRATHLRTASIAAIDIVFLLGLRRPPPSIRRHQIFPDPAVLLCVIAMSISTVPHHGRSLSPPSMSPSPSRPASAQTKPPSALLRSEEHTSELQSQN